MSVNKPEKTVMADGYKQDPDGIKRHLYIPGPSSDVTDPSHAFRA